MLQILAWLQSHSVTMTWIEIIAQLLTIIISTLIILHYMQNNKESKDFMDALEEMDYDGPGAVIKTRFVIFPVLCNDRNKRAYLCRVWRVYAHTKTSGIIRECYTSEVRAFLAYKKYVTDNIFTATANAVVGGKVPIF